MSRYVKESSDALIIRQMNDISLKDKQIKVLSEMVDRGQNIDLSIELMECVQEKQRLKMALSAAIALERPWKDKGVTECCRAALRETE